MDFLASFAGKERTTGWNHRTIKVRKALQRSVSNSPPQSRSKLEVTRACTGLYPVSLTVAKDRNVTLSLDILLQCLTILIPKKFLQKLKCCMFSHI